MDHVAQNTHSDTAIPLTKAAARELTNRISPRLGDIMPLIAEAFHRRADVALGYQSWDRYCHAEFAGTSFPFIERDERRRAVAQLKHEGMSNRAIAHALGIDDRTVRGDLKVTESATAGFPAVALTVTGLDGKSRAAKDALRAQRAQQAAACDAKPIVITGSVKTSPLHYARLAASMLAELDAEHYGPDDLTAEQLRAYGLLRGALAEFSAVWEREETESIRSEEAS